jgi:hypothetical protein
MVQKHNNQNQNPRSQDIGLGIATGYGLDDCEDIVHVPAWSRIFSSPYCSGGSASDPASYTMETKGSLSGRQSGLIV